LHIGVDLDNTILDATSSYLHFYIHNGISYHNIAFTENKLQECINSKVDVLIDDAPHYANEFAHRNMPVILFEQPYNISVNVDLVYHAPSWLEVNRLITKLETYNITKIL
jgi:5'(3')-deoxyribonucleotidase